MMESVHVAVEKFIQKLQCVFSLPFFTRLSFSFFFTLNNRQGEHLVAVILQTKLFFTLAVSPPKHFFFFYKRGP